MEYREDSSEHIQFLENRCRYTFTILFGIFKDTHNVKACLDANFLDFGIVALLFLFDKHRSIMN